jgi:hypothetical protein
MRPAKERGGPAQHSTAQHTASGLRRPAPPASLLLCRDLLPLAAKRGSLRPVPAGSGGAAGTEAASPPERAPPHAEPEAVSLAPKVPVTPESTPEPAVGASAGEGPAAAAAAASPPIHGLELAATQPAVDVAGAGGFITPRRPLAGEVSGAADTPPPSITRSPFE